MSDESLSPEPPRAPRLGGTVSVALLAFVAGVASLALAMWLWGGFRGAPEPAQQLATPQPQAAPAPLPADIDLSTLYAREQALAARLDALENRATVVDESARNSAAYATRAEALMVVAATRRVLSRGQPLGYLETQLQNRFGASQPKAVAAILDFARAPVTIEDLRMALDTIAPRLSSGNPDEGWWRVFRRKMGDLIVLRRDATPSPRPADRLERARHALDAGQPEAALAEVARLPGARNGASWIEAAKRYIRAQRALAALEERALTVARPAS